MALDYATPKQQIVQQLLHGYGQPAYGDISPAHWAYNPNVPHHDFNLSKAASILAADGFTKGSDGVLQKGGVPFAMQLWNSSGQTLAEQINVILKAEWGKLGIKVNMHSESDNTIYGASGPQFSKQMTGIAYGWYNTADPTMPIIGPATRFPTLPPDQAATMWRISTNSVSSPRSISSPPRPRVRSTAPNTRRYYGQIQVLLAEQSAGDLYRLGSSALRSAIKSQGFRSEPVD